jgi:hypothetical protein
VSTPVAGQNLTATYAIAAEVHVDCEDASQEEETSIVDAAISLPSAAPFQCAATVSSALEGQPSFPYFVGGTFWASDLRAQVRQQP